MKKNKQEYSDEQFFNVLVKLNLAICHQALELTSTRQSCFLLKKGDSFSRLSNLVFQLTPTGKNGKFFSGFSTSFRSFVRLFF